MGVFGFYIIGAVSMALYMAIAWVVTSWLHLPPQADTLVRMFLMGLGFAALAFVYQWRERRQRRKESAGQDAQQQTGRTNESATREIDSYIREAEKRLAAARGARDSKLANLPVFFIAGESGSAKTSLFLHSGTEPDLLAGQVYQDTTVVPTRPVNLWLAKDAAFVEAGGRLLSDPARWQGLIKRLRQSARRFFSGRPQAARGAILCIDCDRFLHSGGEEALAAAARGLQERLAEISQTMGVNLPVYVVVTKLDRMNFFTEYASNLTNDEVTQVMGVTLPLGSGGQGIYAEQESRRLTTTFDNLCASLCDNRLPFLARENNAAHLAPVYEFPREFRKLREPLVRFLVDLFRPSQLRANPVLRGFYFSGVRPVTMKEAVPLARGPEREVSSLVGSFDAGYGSASPTVVAQEVRTRRVPQWLFLGHLFSDVILDDKAAMVSSGRSFRGEMVRRGIAMGLGVACLLLSGAFTLSYFRNRALESQVGEAARGISFSETGGAAQELPSRVSLERLDTLRESVEQLAGYERDGAPWSLRWGLYIGPKLYPTARRLYFARFAQIVFGSTQASLVDWLRKLPEKPGANDEYKPSYDTLKGYLITTSHHEKSTRAFLSPLLYERWAGKRQVDAERAALAERQFDFYSDELFYSNPYTSENDSDAVEHARSYLAQFNASENVYQFIIGEASRQNPAVNFNKQYSGSANYIVNNKDVQGAFTVAGWAFFEKALHDLRRYFGGEQWVLGDRAVATFDPATLGPELRTRYQKDFIGNWRAYLANTEMVRYRGIPDAAQKLQQLSGNQSYVLALFCLASINTSLSGNEAASTPYQPVQYVEAPGCTEKLVQDHNGPYLTALASLQGVLERLGRNNGAIPDDLVAQVQNEAANAYRVTRQIAQNFRIDHEGDVHGMVQKIMEDPIKQAEGLLRTIGPAQLNGEGRRFCGAFSELTGKYPFKSDSKTDATLEELNAMFRPGEGKFDQFYESALKNYLDRHESQYARRTDAHVQVTDAFLRFMNHAGAFREALYPVGAKNPALAYDMTSLPAGGGVEKSHADARWAGADFDRGGQRFERFHVAGGAAYGEAGGEFGRVRLRVHQL
jgi:type VI secretion system protein ImpL